MPQGAHGDEQLFLALLFMMLRTPDPVLDKHQQDQRLRRAIVRMVARFRSQTGMNFSDEQGLTDQLYIHLAQALDRSLFEIGIDNSCRRRSIASIPGCYAPQRKRCLSWKRSLGCVFLMKR